MIPWVLVAALVAGSGAQSAAAPASDPPAVSLAAIRKALTGPSPRLRLDPLTPTFRIVVWEAPRFYLPDRGDVGGPAPPGGLVAFEQRQMLGNPWLGQPLFKLDLLHQVEKIGQAIGETRRRAQTEAARQDAARPLIEMCLGGVCASGDQP
jgi:hypothetical protein